MYLAIYPVFHLSHVLNQVREFGISLDALDFVGDNLLDLVLDTVVVLFNLLLHGVVALLVGEVDNLRYLHVTGGFPLDLLVIHDNLGMENLLFDALVEIVRYRPDKHSLCQVTDFGCRDKAVHLGIDGNGSLVAIDCHVLPFLQDFAETLRQCFGGFGNYLTCKDIADGIADHGTFLVAVVPF